MDKKKIFLFVALGAATVGAILAMVGGIVGSLRAFDISVDEIAMGGEALDRVISGVVLLLATPLAFVGAGFTLRKSLLSPILLVLAAAICFVSMIYFNALGLVAGILLVGGAALAVLNWLWTKNNKQEKTAINEAETAVA